MDRHAMTANPRYSIASRGKTEAETIIIYRKYCVTGISMSNASFERQVFADNHQNCY